jgi:cell division septum initiation protein DivIVA
MRDGSEIEALLDSLETLADEGEGKRAKWRDVWSEIKKIGQAFKESRFPNAQDRQAAWNRFQTIVARVKACQERARKEVDERVGKSEHHLEQIRSYAWKATPSSESADALLAIFTGGLSVLIKAGIEAILGPFDERKLELQECSKALKEGWAYLSQNKGEMLGKHKKEAFDVLSNASDSLGRAWDTWKTGRQQAIEHYRAEKRAAWEARQAKREAWEARMRENISKLEDRLDRLESALDRRRSNLSRLEDMRSSAWSDSYRERVDGWISDEHERIAKIERKIDQIKGWISDMTAKLR